MKIRLFVVIISCLMLNSCGSVSEIYIKGEKVATIKQSGNGAVVYNDGTISVQADSRVPSNWDKFIAPILTSAKQNAQANIM